MASSSTDPEVVVLSLRQGHVWVSWGDERPPLKLGGHNAVVGAMTEYLLQTEIANGLVNRAKDYRTQL